MNRKLLLLIAFVTCSSAIVQAQLYLGIHGGATLPQNSYADSRMSDNEWMFTQGHQFKAGAGKGFLAGVDVSFALPVYPALEVAFSADFMQSNPSRDVREYYEYIYSMRYSACSSYEMHLPKFQNIPLLLGVRYAYPASTTIDFYGEALAGVNMRRITDWSLSYASAHWVQPEGAEELEFDNIDSREYTPSTTFAFRLGTGFIINKKITLGASFCMLGSAPLVWNRTTIVRNDIAGQVVENTVQTHTDFHSINPTMVTIQLGYRFNPFKGPRHTQDW